MTTQKFLTQRGRIVQGHPSRRRAVIDNDTKQPVIDPVTGKQKTDVFFALALPKGDPKTEEMIRQIRKIAVQAFDERTTQIPTFSWKFEDGDSTVPKQGNKAPNAEREGMPGHHILKLSTRLMGMPKVCDVSKVDIIEESGIKCGDYVRVVIEVKGNGQTKYPGLYLNPSTVQLLEPGEAIQGARMSASDELDSMEGGGAPSAPAAGQQAQHPALPPPNHVKDFGTDAAPPPPPAEDSYTNGQKTYTREQLKSWTDEQLAAGGWKRVDG